MIRIEPLVSATRRGGGGGDGVDGDSKRSSPLHTLSNVVLIDRHHLLQLLKATREVDFAVEFTTGGEEKSNISPGHSFECHAYCSSKHRS